MGVPQSTYKKSPEAVERETAEALWEGGEFEGLIVLSETGKLYTTQTGGVACHHPEARGYLVPRTVPKFIQSGIENVYGGLCDRQAGYCDGVFDVTQMHMRVDTARLKESEEAWLFVQAEIDDRYRPAILTWENSD